MSVKPLQKGDKVVMHTCIEAVTHDGKVWTCRTNEQKLHEKHDYTVVWLEGFSGCFATKYLQKIDISSHIKQLKENADDIYNKSQPDLNGEVDIECEDALDMMYELIVKS